jgi:hypothetical protein
MQILNAEEKKPLQRAICIAQQTEKRIAGNLGCKRLDLLGWFHRNGILAEFTEYRIDQLECETGLHNKKIPQRHDKFPREL